MGKKSIWAGHQEKSDFTARVFVVSVIIILGAVALLTCIYDIIPALLEGVQDMTG